MENTNKIGEHLQHLLLTKQTISDAINEKGGNTKITDPFINYADEVKNIKGNSGSENSGFPDGTKFAMSEWNNGFPKEILDYCYTLDKANYMFYGINITNAPSETIINLSNLVNGEMMFCNARGFNNTKFVFSTPLYYYGNIFSNVVFNGDLTLSFAQITAKGYTIA